MQGLLWNCLDGRGMERQSRSGYEWSAKETLVTVRQLWTGGNGFGVLWSVQISMGEVGYGRQGGESQDGL